MIIKVCVGSSCHLKGSYDVIEAMKSILKKYDVEHLVELEASFCLGQCAKGVSVGVEDYGDAKVVENARISITDEGLILHNVNGQNAEELFVREILPILK